MAYSRAEIFSLNSAEEGQWVDVGVDVYNLSQYTETFKTEVYAGADLILLEIDSIGPGAVKHYGPHFIMPSSDTTILVWIERYTSASGWSFDYATSKVVLLGVAPPPEPEFRNFGLTQYNKV